MLLSPIVPLRVTWKALPMPHWRHLHLYSAPTQGCVGINNPFLLAFILLSSKTNRSIGKIPKLSSLEGAQEFFKIVTIKCSINNSPTTYTDLTLVQAWLLCIYQLIKFFFWEVRKLAQIHWCCKRGGRDTKICNLAPEVWARCRVLNL